MRELSLAFSPCPNDTFVFHALVHGLLPDAPRTRVTYADVDVTNTAALAGAFDAVKVSYAAVPWLLEEYALLPCGGAVGRGCGPLVLAAADHPPEWLEGRTVAVPGSRSTALLLLRLWAENRPPARLVVMPFEEIMPAVAAGEVDAGLVIHEARFIYPRFGLTALVDLGAWWEEETALPIPLGAILARRDLVDRTGLTLTGLADLVRASVRAAWAAPEASLDYVLRHAQEKDPAVVADHIALYVNRFTETLGPDGFAAASELLTRAAQASLAPALPSHALTWPPPSHP
jgi:1,4-dihydroxy-6-naphthoate synthase